MLKIVPIFMLETKPEFKDKSSTNFLTLHKIYTTLLGAGMIKLSVARAPSLPIGTHVRTKLIIDTKKQGNYCLWLVSGLINQLSADTSLDDLFEKT